MITALISLFFMSGGVFASGYVQIFQGDLLDALRAEKTELAKVDPGLARRLTNRRPVSRDAVEDGASPTFVALPSEEELATFPLASGEEEFTCLSEALYFEARGESVKGIFAVAEVIMNRARSTQFPDTICAVINQGAHRKNACQFSYKCDGIADKIAERRAYEKVAKIARLALDEAVPAITSGALYYHTNAVRPSWSRQFERTASIGVHFFYRPGS